MTVKDKIKDLFSDISEQIDLKAFGHKVFIYSGIIILISNIAGVSTLLSETKSTQAVISSKDNDAGRGIQTAMLTKWYNSNHYAPYGNLYYRFTHTLANLAPITVVGNYNEVEKNEIRHHFALMLTSLLSLTALCFLLSYLLVLRSDYAIWMTSIFLNLSLLDDTWVEYIFRPHPDHTLMLMCAIAAYYTLKLTVSKSHKDFVLSALMWGVATAVKRSTVLFIPSFLFLFLSEGLRKESLIKGFKFLGYMLISYFIIGFPQNFGFYKHIKFLLIESHNAMPASWASIMEYLVFIYDQTKYILGFSIVFHVLFGEKTKTMTKKFSLFMLIAFITLLSRTVETNHNHHVMPFVGMFLVFGIFFIKQLPTLSFKYKPLTMAAFSCVVLYFGTYDPILYSHYKSELHCMSEIKTAMSIVDKIQETTGMKLIKNPYFPFNSSKAELHTQAWGVTMQDIDERGAGIFGTRRGFLNYIRNDPFRPYQNPDYEAWKNRRSFSNDLFEGKLKNFTTPKGSRFEQIYEDHCGLLIWQKAK